MRYSRDMEHWIELKWSRRSIAKVAEILEYVARDNLDAGKKLTSEIRSKAKILR